jgi:hypothetical protein
MISRLSGDKIFSFAMPVYEGSSNGRDFIFADSNKLPEVIHNVFFAEQENPDQINVGNEPTDLTDNPYAHLRIQVLNGSRVAGLGSSVADMLRADGFTVTNVDTFDGSRTNATRIRVSNNLYGQQFMKYFDDASINIVDSMPAAYDVVIIVGVGEG